MNFQEALEYMKLNEKVQSCVSGTIYTISDGQLKAENIVVPSSFVEREEMQGNWKVLKIRDTMYKDTYQYTIRHGGEKNNEIRA